MKLFSGSGGRTTFFNCPLRMVSIECYEKRVGLFEAPDSSCCHVKCVGGFEAPDTVLDEQKLEYGPGDGFRLRDSAPLDKL